AYMILGSRADAASRFCVLAMGKLGAMELNLSSDIDLMYIFEQPAPESGREAATRLAELTTELLSDHCFRTDLRLRPGGRNALLVASLESALNFYQSLGQTWERAALLRARPVAGELELGRRLLVELDRFIFRRYLDFETLRQLRAMKRQIEEELHSGMVERNIKLGYGGIRELEFIAQALTLIYGGRDPRLRSEQTLVVFQRLDTLGYLSSARAQKLASAYLFLRDVEHKLQVVAGLQTHSLPASETEMARLAARLHLGKDAQSTRRLTRALRQYRELIATQFRETLAGGDEAPADQASQQAHSAWQAALDPDSAAPILESLGFAAPRESAGHLILLAHGPSHSPASPRRRELLDHLGPLLLDEISRLSDPDLALMNLAAFIAAVGARTSFLSLLEQHPATRRALLRLFASSGYLSALFIRHPELLDTLVRSDLVRLRRTSGEIAGEIASLIAASHGFEARLDAIRSFRHQEFLRIAIADIAGSLELEEIQTELSLLAETVIRETLTIAVDEIRQRFPIAPTLKLCVIAMGRLGAGEMAYNSDLDLIFVYDDSSEIAGSSRELASRITQKMIAILESRTREGYAYKLDLRLRPSGNAGPLVTSMAGFREYHRVSAAVWERQALLRARAVAGDARLSDEFESARSEFVFRRGLTCAEVGEIASMRIRVEREIGAEDSSRLNLKQGPGGLVDVEFLTQMMAMRHGGRYRELTSRNTHQLIAALGARGLVAMQDTEHLAADYRFLQQLENRLRIETDQASWAVPANPAELTPLARRMGYSGAGGASRMLDELRVRRSRIRSSFNRYFDAERNLRE
ncbi:MAG: bifunctional [glutamate--ammonia ligase]-adenylyl-L-tyrosine phosphorylase/[glutamate--ammonia-ligase] adenylyltransferase, partial [Candidatus Binataceae bacterium]